MKILTNDYTLAYLGPLGAPPPLPPAKPRVGNRRVRVTFHCLAWSMPVATLRYFFDGNPGMSYSADGATTTEATRRAARGMRGTIANMQTGAWPE